jgi:hypothetical protein
MKRKHSGQTQPLQTRQHKHDKQANTSLAGKQANTSNRQNDKRANETQA